MAKETRGPPKKRARRAIDGIDKHEDIETNQDEIVTPIIKVSRESNSELEKQQENLESCDNVKNGKRFQYFKVPREPDKSTKRRRKFNSNLVGQPSISSYFKLKPVLNFLSTTDQSRRKFQFSAE